MRRVILAALALGAPALARGAIGVGDESLAQAPPEIIEISHKAHVRLEDGVARWTIRRTLQNRGAQAGEAILGWALPPAGAVTGFRLFDEHGSLLGEGRLDDAAAAELRYLELRAPGDAAPTRIGLLAWEDLGRVRLRAFPIYPGEKLAIELEATAAVGYVAGRYQLEYPAWSGGPGEAPVQLSIDPGREGVDVEIYASPVPGEGTQAVIYVEPPAIAETAGRFALLSLAKDQHVARLELEAAPQLGEVPADARIVFVLDASWSEDKEGIAAQLQIVRGVLANMPDARFEIVLFDREARRLAGGFVPVGELDRLLADAAREGRLQPKNGSDPVVGLELAAKALAGEKRPARVIVMSDLQFPHAYQAARAIAALKQLPKRTIVHAVERWPDSGGELAEQRIDTPGLAEVAAAYGGQMLLISGGSEELEALRLITLGLARPIRIDDFAVTGDGLEEGVFADAPAPLREGEGWRAMALAEKPAKSVTLSGRIWGKAYKRTLKPDAAFAAHLPALLFGDALHEGLSPTEIERAALLGGVVSPMTSYLIAADDAEASVLGLDDNWGTLSGGMAGCSSRCGGCTGYGYAIGEHVDWAALVIEAVTPGFAACARAHGKAEAAGSLFLEHTADEIVAVKLSGVGDKALSACLTEATWSVRLPPAFTGHRTIDVPFTVPAR